MHLTNGEWEVMGIFWNAGEPLTQAELLARADRDRSWKDRSVYILLNRLLKKGMLKEDGFVRSNKAFARRFSPTMSFESYLVAEMYSHAVKPDLPRLLDALMERDAPDPQTIEELRKICRQRSRRE